MPRRPTVQKTCFLFVLVLCLNRIFIPNELLLYQSQEKLKTRTKGRRPLPTPILVVGLPKTGTSTVHKFFEQSGYRSSHYRCKEERIYCGVCFQTAIENNTLPLESCGKYEVYAQMDVENWDQCHFPQITDLDSIHKEAPNATFLLTTRNMTHWVTSVTNWVGGVRSMALRLAHCRQVSDGRIGPKTNFPNHLIEWHDDHIQRIRAFVQNHPSHTLIEIDIEDPITGQIMAELFGSEARYWGHENDSLHRKKASLTARKKET